MLTWVRILPRTGVSKRGHAGGSKLSLTGVSNGCESRYHRGVFKYQDGHRLAQYQWVLKSATCRQTACPSLIQARQRGMEENLLWKDRLPLPRAPKEKHAMSPSTVPNCHSATRTQPRSCHEHDEWATLTIINCHAIVKTTKSSWRMSQPTSPRWAPRPDYHVWCSWSSPSKWCSWSSPSKWCSWTQHSNYCAMGSVHDVASTVALARCIWRSSVAIGTRACSPPLESPTCPRPIVLAKWLIKIIVI